MSSTSSLSSMRTITRKEIVKTVAVRKGLTLEITKEIIDKFLSEITEELAKGNRIEFRHFGVFSPKVLKELDRAINPRTGKSIGPLPARKTARFKPTGILKDLGALRHERHTN